MSPRTRTARRYGWLFALALGLVFTLGLLEGAFRVLDYAWARKLGASQANSGGEAILVLGNSHTKGMLPTAGYSYPSQLEALMRARAPGRAVSVVNAGEINVNSAEILATLRQQLPIVRPKVVVVMAGEANYWNRRHSGHGAGLEGALPGILLKSKALRFLFLALNPHFHRTLLERRPGYSIFFLDTPLAEYPTLAMRWVGHLSANRDYRLLPREGLVEAVAMIRSWRADPRSAGTMAAAVKVQASIELFLGEREAALGTLEQFAAKGDFSLPLLDWALERREQLSAAGVDGGPRWRSAIAALGAAGPRANRLARIRTVAAGKSADAEILPEAAKADSGNLVLVSRHAERLHQAGRVADAEAEFLRGLRENPFQAAGELPPYQFHAYLGLEIFRRACLEALPPAAAGNGEKPGSSQIAQALLHTQDILEWAKEDLTKIVREAREAGAGVLLQTYPPERNSGSDRTIDHLIREVAETEKAALSDTSRELRRIWGEAWGPEKASRFYGTPGMPFADDHLNQEGNRLVAELLLADLERAGLWKP